MTFTSGTMTKNIVITKTMLIHRMSYLTLKTKISPQFTFFVTLFVTDIFQFICTLSTHTLVIIIRIIFQQKNLTNHLNIFKNILEGYEWQQKINHNKNLLFVCICKLHPLTILQNYKISCLTLSGYHMSTNCYDTLQLSWNSSDQQCFDKLFWLIHSLAFVVVSPQMMMMIIHPPVVGI